MASPLSAWAASPPAWAGPLKLGLWTTIGSTVGGQKSSRMICVTPATQKIPTAQNGQTKFCLQTHVQKTATGMTYDAVCKFGDFRSGSHVAMSAPDDAHRTIRSVINSTMSGRPFKMDMTITMTWIGADCGNVKPLTELPTPPKITGLPPTPKKQTPFEAGSFAWATGDKDGAMKIWEPLEKSDPFNFGMAAYVRHDYPMAIKIWRPLAEKGNADAANSIASLYVWGYEGGVPRDLAQSAKWSRVAALLGNAEGELNLSRDYHNGDGVPKDPVRSYMWMSLALDNTKGSSDGSQAARISKMLAMFAEKNMTGIQVAQAKEMAALCNASQYKDCD